ncbi:hypothetical protein Y1Q_0006506 [Alligator mississippiensis]|uniref:Cation-transporting P-type ATPase C-terminal domain-containing protein n=1 Tax=Alligator mississippiensis TaxID=8496 RepID=A0A151PJ59_ALLMI|nr:hypothetical protein Y1Q_0006506 [Alligator mississippiensis]
MWGFVQAQDGRFLPLKQDIQAPSLTHSPLDLLELMTQGHWPFKKEAWLPAYHRKKEVRWGSSPDAWIPHCWPCPVPEDFPAMLETCTHRGLRVVALATQRLEPHVPWHKLQHLSRDLVVQDMDFLGLVMLQNKLKPESARILGELHHACVRPIMVTGDNMLTAISVAQECVMIPPKGRTPSLAAALKEALSSCSVPLSMPAWHPTRRPSWWKPYSSYYVGTCRDGANDCGMFSNLGDTQYLFIDMTIMSLAFTAPPGRAGIAAAAALSVGPDPAGCLLPGAALSACVRPALVPDPRYPTCSSPTCLSLNPLELHLQRFRYIAVAVAFAKGPPFHQAPHTNCPFLAAVMLTSVFVLLLLWPNPALAQFFESYYQSQVTYSQLEVDELGLPYS